MIIPFFIPHAGCPHQCVFCNQKRITGREKPVDPGMISETIRSYLAVNKKRDQAAEVAFFGGTFTALPPELQKIYLDEVAPFIAAGSISGIRISTRPDAINPEVLALLKKGRVATVELGVQSLDDEVLRSSGRGHTAEDSVAATQLLNQHRFSVGFQLMPGLPADSIDRFRLTISRTLELKPDFVRLYPALVIKDTALEQLFRGGRYAPLRLEEAVSWCKEAFGAFRDAGIPVIRAGLQSTGELESPGTILAGPYHPAFRQMVESALLLDAMLQAMETAAPGNAVVFRVNPRDISTAVGQNRCNITALKLRFGLNNVSFMTDRLVRRGAVMCA